MTHKAIALIPARGGSKRIPRKNIVDLNGKPLLAHTINSAKKSKLLSHIFLSTDDREIESVVKGSGIGVIKRPKNLARDRSSTLDVLKHAIGVLENQGLEFDTLVVLQPTSPFRKTSTIDKGVKKLWANWSKYDAIFSVVQTKFPPLWMLRIRKHTLEFLHPNDFSTIRGQDLDKTFHFDGVLYILKKDFVLKSRLYPFSHGRTGFVITGKVESFDIDDLEDLEIAKAISKRIKL